LPYEYKINFYCIISNRCLAPHFSAYKTDIKTSFNSLSIIASTPYHMSFYIKGGNINVLAYEVDSVASIIFYRSKDG
jgi:hypothetical protein